jgi:hypothetical protein
MLIHSFDQFDRPLCGALVSDADVSRRNYVAPTDQEFAAVTEAA